MLSRTADHLYWMARYIERAENMARVLDVTYNMSLVPNAAESEAALWVTALYISGNVDAYERDYSKKDGDEYTAAGVERLLGGGQRDLRGGRGGGGGRLFGRVAVTAARCREADHRDDGATANRCRNPTTSQTIQCHLRSFSWVSKW